MADGTTSNARLAVYIGLWYLGNYYFNIFNKQAGLASGGSQFAFTLAWFQLAIGSVYAVLPWLLGVRARPTLTFAQFMQLMPLGFYTAAAHGSAIFANLSGSLSFGQIVKAGEPVFAALIGFLFYRTSISVRRLACLVPIVGGIVLASAAGCDFSLPPFISMSIANAASAFRGGENKRVMRGELKEAIGGVSNAFACTTLWATLLLFPAAFLSGEAARVDEFVELWRSDGLAGSSGRLQFNAIMSGIIFYLYNEISTLALGSLSGVSHSVANTAKRAVVIVGPAFAFGESLGPAKAVGCVVAIGGVMLYAIVDELGAKVGEKAVQKAKQR